VPYFDHPFWGRTREEFFQRCSTALGRKERLLRRAAPTFWAACRVRVSSPSDLMAPPRVAGTYPCCATRVPGVAIGTTVDVDNLVRVVPSVCHSAHVSLQRRRSQRVMRNATSLVGVRLSTRSPWPPREPTVLTRDRQRRFGVQPVGERAGRGTDLGLWSSAHSGIRGVPLEAGGFRSGVVSPPRGNAIVSTYGDSGGVA
jgi:hypothetical protein